MYIAGINVAMGVILKFYVFSILLAAIFLSLSLVIGMLSKTRFQALGASLIVWAFMVLFYEFIVMGLSMIVPKQSVLTLLSTSIFLNPVELIRVWSILSLDGASVFGPSIYDLTVWANGFFGQLLFYAISILWLIIPGIISGIVLKRRVGNE